jgi:hypothetical protein
MTHPEVQTKTPNSKVDWLVGPSPTEWALCCCRLTQCDSVLASSCCLMLNCTRTGKLISRCTAFTRTVLNCDTKSFAS